MKLVEDQFNSTFARWKILLPSGDVENRHRGKIVKAGWAIWYLFGSDKKGEFLDYYASHRMTNDRHVRIYSSGEMKGLPVIREMRICSKDPEEDKRLETKFCAANQRVERLLKKKGFGITGDEPGGVQINRFLRVRGSG